MPAVAFPNLFRTVAIPVIAVLVAAGPAVAPTPASATEGSAARAIASADVGDPIPSLGSSTITIAKEVTGGASSYAAPTFTMVLQCFFEHVPVVYVPFNLRGGHETLFAVPDPGQCNVTETKTGGATFPAPPKIVQIEGPTRVVMENRYEPTDLVLTVRSEAVGEDHEPATGVAIDPGDLHLAVTCTLDGRHIRIPTPAVNGIVTVPGAATSGADGVSLTVEDLPQGAKCSVTEQPGSGATRTQYLVNGEPAGAETEFELGPVTNSVQVGNVYDLAPLTIEKVLDGDAEPPADATFGGEVTCTFHGNPVQFTEPRVFSGLTAAGSVVVHDLPIGAACTVTETDTAGADAVGYRPAQTVPIADDSRVEIVNTFTEGALTVQVLATGPGAWWAHGDTGVEVDCTLDGLTVLQDVFTVPGHGAKSYTPPEGSVCTATETVNGGATGVQYWSSEDSTPSPTPVTVNVTESSTLTVADVFEAAPVTVTVTPSGDGQEFAEPFTVTVGACVFDGVPVDLSTGASETELHFGREGGVAVIPELVAGATCDAVMTGAGGATSTQVTVDNGAPSTPVGADGTSFTVHPPGTTIAFDAAFEVAALDVTVEVEGDAAWAANVRYGVQVQCSLDGEPIHELGPDGIVLLPFEPDGTPVDDPGHELLQTLPVGASCTVTEPDQGGATQVAVSASPVVVAADGAAVTVTNTFDPSTLTITKQVGGNAADEHSEDVFEFELACTFNNLPIENPPTDPDRALTFGLSNGQTASFADRPVGSACTVTETDDQHATSVTPGDEQQIVLPTGGTTLTFTNTFDTAQLTVTEQLSGPGAETYGQPGTYVARVLCDYPDGTPAALPADGELILDAGNGFTGTIEVPVGTTCTAEQPWYFATRQLVTEPVTILLGDEPTITITSDFALGTITTGKEALGDYPADLEFGFAIDCVWPETDEMLPLNDGGATGFTLQSGQERTVSVLAGARCTITETDAEGALRIDTTATGAEAQASGAQAVVTSSPDQQAQVRVTNYMSGSLPVTGPELAGIAAVLGVLLLAGGAVLIVVRRRTRSV